MFKEIIDPQYWHIIKNENNHTIDGEKTLRILASANNTTIDDIYKNYKYIVYATLHDNSAYLFSLYGDSKSFNRYLFY